MAGNGSIIVLISLILCLCAGYAVCNLKTTKFNSKGSRIFHPHTKNKGLYVCAVVMILLMFIKCVNIAIVSTGFMTTPSSLNKTVEQGEAVFRCQHRSSDDIIWRVNGAAISSPNISEWRVPVGDGGFASFLSIPTLPGFNNTTIECVAIFLANFFVLLTAPATLLLIQGMSTTVFPPAYLKPGGPPGLTLS